jgi:hypothetical protein
MKGTRNRREDEWRTQDGKKKIDGGDEEWEEKMDGGPQEGKRVMV